MSTIGTLLSYLDRESLRNRCGEMSDADWQRFGADLDQIIKETPVEPSAEALARTYLNLKRVLRKYPAINRLLPIDDTRVVGEKGRQQLEEVEKGRDDRPLKQQLQTVRDNVASMTRPVPTSAPSIGQRKSDDADKNSLDQNVSPAPDLDKPRVEPEDDPAKTVEDVNFGVSTPSSVRPGESFVVRFAAYTDDKRDAIAQVFALEAPLSISRLNLEKCTWQRGAIITVRLRATNARVLQQSTQTFKWNGDPKILRFDVRVHKKVFVNNVILKIEIAVAGFPIVSLRPEIEIKQSPGGDAKSDQCYWERSAPKTAFASYASEDQLEVLSRVRSVEIMTGIKVFKDRLSIRPGDEWKSIVKHEIINRDSFWLFWSRSAMKSLWVDWEWRTALASKSLIGMQPHPLEPMELAPAPQELSGLQFGSMYEWYLTLLRESSRQSGVPFPPSVETIRTRSDRGDPPVP